MYSFQPNHALDPIDTGFNGEVPSEFSGGRPGAVLWETGRLNLLGLQNIRVCFLFCFHLVHSGFCDLLCNSFEQNKAKMWLEFASGIEHWEAEQLNVFLARPPRAGPHSDTPLLSAETPTSFIAHGNYWSPLENAHIFRRVLPLCSIQKSSAFTYFTGITVATDVLSSHSTQVCDSSVHVCGICSGISGSVFFCLLAAWPPWADFFPLLCFVDTLPHLKHIISFKKFNQFVINECDKELSDHKRLS